MIFTSKNLKMKEEKMEGFNLNLNDAKRFVETFYGSKDSKITIQTVPDSKNAKDRADLKRIMAERV